jgi:hypothetical protein
MRSGAHEAGQMAEEPSARWAKHAQRDAGRKRGCRQAMLGFDDLLNQTSRRCSSRLPGRRRRQTRPRGPQTLRGIPFRPPCRTRTWRSWPGRNQPLHPSQGLAVARFCFDTFRRARIGRGRGFATLGRPSCRRSRPLGNLFWLRRINNLGSVGGPQPGHVHRGER